MSILPYVRIARPDHWLKNIFVLPGVLLALFFEPVSLASSLWGIAAGLAATCLIASSNYVLNEILDARFDLFHPEKKSRPIPSGQVHLPAAYALWLALAAAGIGLGFAISVPFGLSGGLLWVMGVLYNVPPIRLKDAPYFDVLSESVNNPIRLAMGWYAVGAQQPPPLSVIVAYWMFGAFLMAAKRFSEYRRIADVQAAGCYRRSFRWYTEERLLVSILFYVGFFGMMSGVFISRYRIELVLATPVVVYAMAYYLHMAFKPDSAAQHPEGLYRERGLMAVLTLAFGLCGLLLFWDIPLLEHAFPPLIDQGTTALGGN